MIARALALSVALLLAAWAAQSAVYYAGAFRSANPVYACNNGIDDDGDGATDSAADPGCSSASDNSELNVAIECDNGLDDDADGLIDYKTSGGDPGCSSRTDTQEGPSATAACNDGIDNDGDGATDHPADTGCTATTDTNELNLGVQCDDGLDNDSDTFIDFKLSGGDPQCSDSLDNTEAAPVTPACSNGLDDDGDGATDYPADPGCGSAADIYEFGSNECDDNLDNDGDTDTDYPDDTDCDSPSDLTEAADIPLSICENGVDDDGDGLIDWPADTGCTNVTDADETDPAYPCDDSADNDGDSTADYRLSGGDPGCSSVTDPSETYGTQCDNGLDDDGDGDVDYPDDANCDDALDDSEAAPPPATNLTAAGTIRYMQGVSSCVAPCLVHADATATTDPTVPIPFRDLVYEWDCGAGATGNWSTDGKARRYMRGPITGCLLQTDGAHTITLTVTNPASGEVDTENFAVTVTPITSAFTGANIHCFSNDTDHTGCPSGATQHDNVLNFNAALATTCNADAAKVACLFKRGDAFSGSGVALTNTSVGTIGIVGAYGTGADPVITSATSGFGPASNWVVTGLDMNMSGGSAYTAMGGDRDRFTSISMDFTGFTGGCYSTGTPDGSRLNTLEGLVETNCARAVGGAASMMLHRGNYFLGLGSTWDNGEHSGTEYTYRTVGTAHSAYQHLVVKGAGLLPPSDYRNPVQFRAWSRSSGSGPPAEPMNYVVFSDNVLECHTTLCIKIYQNNIGSPEPGSGGAGSGGAQEVSDFIFERNFFYFSDFGPTHAFSSGVIHGHGGRMTVRNNIIDAQGITALTGATAEQRGFSFAASYTNCFLCTESDNTVIGNTFYYDEDINDPLNFCLSTVGSGHACEHNLVYRPNDATVGSQDVGSATGDDWTVGSSWVQQNNLRTGTLPFSATPPDRGLSTGTDFQLSGGSAARNRGTPLRRLDRDYCAATRPNSTSHDAGAWEQGATCP